MVPSKYPPGKSSTADYEKRLEWTRQIFNQLPFQVSDFEKKSSQTIFARDIFYHLSLQAPEAEYFWVLGEDQWEQLQFWKQIEDYARHLHWVVMTRTEAKNISLNKQLSRRLKKTTACYSRAPLEPKPQISSTKIRESVGSQKKDAEVLSWIPEKIRKDVIATYQAA